MPTRMRVAVIRCWYVIRRRCFDIRLTKVSIWPLLHCSLLKHLKLTLVVSGVVVCLNLGVIVSVPFSRLSSLLCTVHLLIEPAHYKPTVTFVVACNICLQLWIGNLIKHNNLNYLKLGFVLLYVVALEDTVSWVEAPLCSALRLCKLVAFTCPYPFYSRGLCFELSRLIEVYAHKWSAPLSCLRLYVSSLHWTNTTNDFVLLHC